jgi:hypothetical protein
MVFDPGTTIEGKTGSTSSSAGGSGWTDFWAQVSSGLKTAGAGAQAVQQAITPGKLQQPNQNLLSSLLGPSKGSSSVSPWLLAGIGGLAGLLIIALLVKRS